MKKIVLFAILTTTLFCFTSCQKDDEAKFSYPMETLYGIWSGSEIYMKSDSKWIDITKYPYTEFAFSIRFNSDGTYYGSGYFGTGDGTYKAIGKTITTYVEGEEYARYTVKSLSDSQAELTMTMGTSTLDIRVKKK